MTASLVATVLILTLGIGASSANAGDKLGDFEKEIEKNERRKERQDPDKRKTHRSDDYVEDPSSAPYPGYPDDRASEDKDEEALGSLLATILLAHAGPTLEQYQKRRGGRPANSIFRLETGYQKLRDSDVDAVTIRTEMVWAFLGISGEFLRYSEDSPDQELDFGSLEALYRFAPSNKFRLDLAVGTRWIEGEGERSGISGGVSVGYYPTHWLGLEADARWANIADATLEDYRGAVSLRFPQFPYVALRSGYRSISYGSETLDGPEVGAVFTW
jgi:hypothetical protein